MTPKRRLRATTRMRTSAETKLWASCNQQRGRDNNRTPTKRRPRVKEGRQGRSLKPLMNTRSEDEVFGTEKGIDNKLVFLYKGREGALE